jgi:hypothetical protein
MTRRFFEAATAGLLMLPLTSTLAAQTKVIPGERVTVTATVEAIDHANRVVTLKGPKGNYVDVDVAPDVKRFDQVKVGDTLTATYYDNIVLTVQQPGQKPKDAAEAAITKSASTRPGGTAAKQRTITVVIDAIDPSIPSISFKGPNGWQYSSRVEDKNVLKTVKVGDKVDITWTQALLLSLEPPK